MQIQAPIPAAADMTVTSYDLHRSRKAVDRGALIIALVVAAIAGITAGQHLDSLAIGLVIGSTLFAALAPLLAAATR